MILFAFVLLLQKPTLHFVKEWEIKVPASKQVGLGSVSGRLYAGSKLVDLKTGALLNKNLGDGNSREIGTGGIPLNTHTGELVQIAGNPYLVFWKGQKVWVALQKDLPYMNIAMIRPHTHEIVETYAMRAIWLSQASSVHLDESTVMPGVSMWFFGDPDKGYLTVVWDDLGPEDRELRQTWMILLPQRRLAKPALWNVDNPSDLTHVLGNPLAPKGFLKDSTKYNDNLAIWSRDPTQTHMTCFNAFTGKIAWIGKGYQAGKWVGNYVLAVPDFRLHYDRAILDGSNGQRLFVPGAGIQGSSVNDDLTYKNYVYIIKRVTKLNRLKKSAIPSEIKITGYELVVSSQGGN